MDWKFIGASFNDRFVINGVDIFKEDWERTGEVISVKDPQYGQSFKFNVWRVEKDDQVITFAAGEFSNSVFGFYVKK